jgi:hypothetical protein
MNREMALYAGVVVVLVMVVAILVGAPAVGQGCTVAVISGAATKDGRPLLWKNRDSGYEANRLVYRNGNQGPYIGLVNAEDRAGDEVWAGVNAAGFCIMNSASYNLYPADEPDSDAEQRRKDEEGLLMRMALERCATVDDFQQLLLETSGDRGVEANFGVIDGAGGAAFFETSNTTFVRFDAGDRRVAPEGYLVRTNYSFTGGPNQGAGYIRFDRASLLFHQAMASGGISRDWLLSTASRDMVNGLTGSDPLAAQLPAHARDHRYYYAADSIVRNTACATALFQGVKPGEDPTRTIMWARLGHPLCSVALPQWVTAADTAELTTGEDSAAIDRFALYWLDRIFPLSGGSRDRYLDLAPVINRDGTGILLRLVAIEQEILVATDSRLQEIGAGETAALQAEIEGLARRLLRQEFPDASSSAGL